MRLLVNLLILPLSLYATHSISADLVRDLKTCQKITSNNQRLACYDGLANTDKLPQKSMTSTTVSSTNSAIKNTVAVAENPPTVVAKADTVVKTAVVIKAETETETKASQQNIENAFGKEHLKKTTEEANQTVIFTISHLKKMIRGEWKITFDNGQLWQQIDSARFKLKIGDDVELKKGFFNVIYLYKKNTHKSIKVKRIK